MPDPSIILPFPEARIVRRFSREAELEFNFKRAMLMSDLEQAALDAIKKIAAALSDVEARANRR